MNEARREDIFSRRAFSVCTRRVGIVRDALCTCRTELRISGTVFAGCRQPSQNVPELIDRQKKPRQTRFSAERGGFEPPIGLYPNNHLAGGPVQPLRHLPVQQLNYIPNSKKQKKLIQNSEKRTETVSAFARPLWLNGRSDGSDTASIRAAEPGCFFLS